jgi:hypothetical protein
MPQAPAATSVALAVRRNVGGARSGLRTLRSVGLDRQWGLSSAGRAVALQASGRRFDPDRLHHFLRSYPVSIERDCALDLVEVRVLPCWVRARMFEIVKRRHIRPAGNLVLRTSHGPQPCAPDMLGKQNMSFGEIQETGLS